MSAIRAGDLGKDVLPLFSRRNGICARANLSPLFGALLAVALVVPPSFGATQPPDVTGTWTDPGGTTWQLQASGPGLSLLHASWQGTGGHSSLRGTFAGMLSQQSGVLSYVGTMRVTEGATAVGGRMTFVIVAADKLSMSYQGANGGHGENIILSRRGPAASPPVPPSTFGPPDKWVLTK